MEKRLEYKEKIDACEDWEIEDVLATIGGDAALAEMDREGLLFYGNYKMDYFEEAIGHMKKLWNYMTEEWAVDGNLLPEGIRWMGDFGDACAIYAMTDGCEDCDCCSLICYTWIFCSCMDYVCGSCTGGGSIIENMAAESGCCAVQFCAPKCNCCTHRCIDGDMCCILQCIKGCTCCCGVPG